MTWKQLTERDCREWKLSAIDPHDRHTWRSGERSAMCAASQLPGRGTLMWMCPHTCVLIKNLKMIMIVDKRVNIYHIALEKRVTIFFLFITYLLIRGVNTFFLFTI